MVSDIMKPEAGNGTMEKIHLKMKRTIQYYLLHALRAVHFSVAMKETLFLE